MALLCVSCLILKKLSFLLNRCESLFPCLCHAVYLMSAHMSIAHCSAFNIIQFYIPTRTGFTLSQICRFAAVPFRWQYIWYMYAIFLISYEITQIYGTIFVNPPFKPLTCERNNTATQKLIYNLIKWCDKHSHPEIQCVYVGCTTTMQVKQNMCIY